MPTSKETAEKRKSEIALKKAVSDIVSKRKNAKIEFGYALELDGTVATMNRGGKSSCKITDSWDRVGVHNHPDSDLGAIGGTFSPADLASMYLTNRPINYAIDREYIYELRALNWKPLGKNNYDGGRLKTALELKDRYNKFIRNADAKSYNRAKELMQQGRFDKPDGTVDMKRYWGYQARMWHAMLGNWLKNHANEFGYEYHVHSIRAGGLK